MKALWNPTSVYLDAAAATPVCHLAREAMHAVEHIIGNPGSQHAHGRHARAVYEDARARIARVLAVRQSDILVTASATEANNLAILGAIKKSVLSSHVRPHIITTAIEHSSVLEVCASLDIAAVADVTLLPVDTHGQVRVETLRAALRPETRLVTIGWANGEVGTVQPLRALVRCVRDSERAHGTRILVHTDAGQVGFAHSMQPQGIDVDMMTLSSGKLYGPRSAAVLYAPYDTPLCPVLFGGHQERGLRPGTEDVVPLVGFAAALEYVEQNRTHTYTKLTGLTALFLKLLAKAVPSAVVNGGHGGAKDALPHIVNISIPGVDSEYVMLALDHKGISISTKSICVEATGEPVSHVVAAMVGTAPDAWRAATTLRFSLHNATTEADIRYTVASLTTIVAKHVAVDK